MSKQAPNRSAEWWKSQKEDIERLYHEESWTQYQLAEHFGMSQTGILKVMRRLGIKARVGCPGKLNGRYKDGSQMRPYRKLVTLDKCRRCGSTDRLGVHHKNDDHYDNRVENLEVLCNSCHMSITKTKWWRAKREGKPLPKSNGPVGWNYSRKAMAIVAFAAIVGGAVVDASEPWYHESSPWRQPIGPNPDIVQGASYYVDGDPAKGMRAFAGERLTSDTSQYTYGIHYVDSSMPTTTVSFDGVLSEVQDTDGDGDEDVTIRHRWGRGTYETHFNPDARYVIPSGSDAQLIFVNRDTGEEFAIWQAQDRNGNGLWEPWEGEGATSGYVYDIRWTGYPPTVPDNNQRHFLSRGAGVPYGVGTIRAEEIAAGRIEHAIAFAFASNHDEAFVFPATKTDGYKISGDGPLGMTLAEGQLVQLDPDLDLEALGLSPAGVVIARALQEFGMRTVDNSRSFKLFAEHESTAGWSTLPEGHAVVRDTVSRIPVEAFRPIVSQHAYNRVVDIHEYAKPPQPTDEWREHVTRLDEAVAAMEARVRELEATVERVKGALE